MTLKYVNFNIYVLTFLIALIPIFIDIFSGQYFFKKLKKISFIVVFILGALAIYYNYLKDNISKKEQDTAANEVIKKFDSSLSKSIFTLQQNLIPIVGKPSATRLIKQSFPGYTTSESESAFDMFPRHEIIYYTSAPDKPIFEYAFYSAFGNTYNIDLKYYILSQIGDKRILVNGPEKRLPTNFTINKDIVYTYIDTIFSAGPRDFYYFLFLGHYTTNKGNRLPYRRLFVMDMKTHQVGSVTNPLEADIFQSYKSFRINPDVTN